MTREAAKRGDEIRRDIEALEQRLTDMKGFERIVRVEMFLDGICPTEHLNIDSLDDDIRKELYNLLVQLYEAKILKLESELKQL